MQIIPLFVFPLVYPEFSIEIELGSQAKKIIFFFFSRWRHKLGENGWYVLIDAYLFCNVKVHQAQKVREGHQAVEDLKGKKGTLVNLAHLAWLVKREIKDHLDAR